MARRSKLSELDSLSRGMGLGHDGAGAGLGDGKDRPSTLGQATPHEARHEARLARREEVRAELIADEAREHQLKQERGVDYAGRAVWTTIGVSFCLVAMIIAAGALGGANWHITKTLFSTDTPATKTVLPPTPKPGQTVTTYRAPSAAARRANRRSASALLQRVAPERVRGNLRKVERELPPRAIVNAVSLTHKGIVTASVYGKRESTFINSATPHLRVKYPTPSTVGAGTTMDLAAVDAAAPRRILRAAAHQGRDLSRFRNLVLSKSSWNEGTMDWAATWTDDLTEATLSLYASADGRRVVAYPDELAE